jgi:glycyl-tRNA synthetase beta chain
VRWVRPLHGIVCTLDGEVVPFEFAGVKSGDVTYGHRFLSQGPIEVRRFEDYEKKLHDAYVLIDPARRKEIIWEDAKAQAFVHNLEPIADEGLLEEVSGLAEWPVVLTGKIEDQFMDVPAEILQTSMRTHQKYFSTHDPKTGNLANRFIVVANMVAQDGGKEIIAGTERVLRARLSDAKFFWDQDRSRTLESRIPDLANIRYYDEYTYANKVDSIAMKAKLIAAKIGADEESAQLASKLCKADLTTGVVGEFPELQGIMGGYYYLAHNPNGIDVAHAIRDHYKPLGPNDSLPAPGIAAAVALGDKLATLYWLFLEGERPTGSKDPYALRRAALGIVRIVLENEYRLPLKWLLEVGWFGALTASTEEDQAQTERDIIEFIIDRLKVVLRDRGARHDLVDAVFSLGNEDDLVRLVDRVNALQVFLKDEDGANLLVAYRRAANILRIEEKKGGFEEGGVDERLLTAPEEKELWIALLADEKDVARSVEQEDFVKAMAELSGLRKPVDAFFDKVTVNDKDPALRKNRLLLLSRLRSTLHLVADFSKIEV